MRNGLTNQEASASAAVDTDRPRGLPPRGRSPAEPRPGRRLQAGCPRLGDRGRGAAQIRRQDEGRRRSRQGVQRVRRRSRVFCPVRAFHRSDEAHPRPEGLAAVPSPPVQSWSRVQTPRRRPRSRARARVRAPWSRGQVTFPVTGGSAGAAMPVP